MEVLEASSFPSSAYFWKVALVPEDVGLVTRTMLSSGPPTSFQFVVFPVKMSMSCCFVRSSTPPSLTSLFTIGAIVTTHTWWSTSSFACASSSFADASTSELPMFTVPSETCFKPSPDPPASIVMETSGYFSINMSAASSTSGFNAEEPAAVMEPVSAAVSVAAVVSAAAAVVSAAAVVAAAVVDAVLLLPHPVIMLTAKTPAPASAITFPVFIISFSSSKGLCFCFSFSVQ